MKGHSIYRLISLVAVMFLATDVARGQTLCLKSNAVRDLAGTLNVGAEYAVSENITIEASLNYNPWTFENNRKNKQVVFQPEVRYWTFSAFCGFFCGAELHVGGLNRGGMPNRAFIPEPMFGISSEDYNMYRYQGVCWGGGAVAGYSWIVSKHMSIEASLALGYSSLNVRKYYQEAGGAKLGEEKIGLWGVTQLGLSFVYVLF